MKYLFSILCGVACLAKGFSQKPVIDTSAYKEWPSVESASISNNGQYVFYSIRHGSIFRGGVFEQVIASTKNNWKLELPGVGNVSFTDDSRYAVFNSSPDSIAILQLGSSSIHYVTGAGSFRLVQQPGGELLIYTLKGKEKELCMYNLSTGAIQSFKGVKSYWLAANRTLVLLCETAKSNTTLQELKWIELAEPIEKVIWQSEDPSAKPGAILFDKQSRQIAFIVSKKVSDETEHSIFYYKAGNSRAETIAADEKIEQGLQLNSLQQFSRDGERLFISLQERPYPKHPADAVKVNVWNYLDTVNQSYQLKNTAPQSYTAVMNINDQHILRLEQVGESIAIAEQGQDEFVLVTATNRGGLNIDLSEKNWNSFLTMPVYIQSTKDGVRRRMLPLENKHCKTRVLSTGGKYVLYYDGGQKDFFTLELKTGIVRNVTKGVRTNWTNADNDRVGTADLSYYPAGWLADDEAAILYDQFDIWKIDPLGIKPAVNLTNGYGRRNRIELRIAINARGREYLALGNSILVNGYNRITKENGFFNVVDGRLSDPEKLLFGPYMYHVPDIRIDIHGVAPKKARDADVYLLQRMSATESPNFFATTDFKTIQWVSDIHPEKEYNWLTTELHSWKKTDGQMAEGVLFKPENFDPKKKYPVIFFYYEKVSDYLHAFVKPDALSNGCTINIPTLVSKGYLVFCPDIRYTVGEVMESTISSVVSAGKYIGALPFVDSKKMGLQGCSFGSIETNLIITHSNLFAAACSASGVSDFVGGYGSLDGDNGSSNMDMYETGQMRMGATIWERPDLYIKNSAIFRTDKVTTPVLLMHTTNDTRCLFSSAIEFYTGLRRLGKKAWMLEYEDGNHGILGKSATDFSIRMNQFFDHYLKDKPAPIWMTQGIPYKLKGIKTGLEYDMGVKTPPQSPLINTSTYKK